MKYTDGSTCLWAPTRVTGAVCLGRAGLLGSGVWAGFSTKGSLDLLESVFNTTRSNTPKTRSYFESDFGCLS